MSFERMTIRMPLNTCMFCLAEAQPNNDFLLIKLVKNIWKEVEVGCVTFVDTKTSNKMWA
jgi:hypothetical protein